MIQDEQAKLTERVLELTQRKASRVGVSVTAYMAGILEGRYPLITSRDIDDAADDAWRAAQALGQHRP